MVSLAPAPVTNTARFLIVYGICKRLSDPRLSDMDRPYIGQVYPPPCPPTSNDWPGAAAATVKVVHSLDP